MLRAIASSHERRAVAMLSRYADPERGPGWNARAPSPPELNVPRTRALLDLLGAPDRSFTCVLIAGTKGKGSTAAFLARVLAFAGIRAGLYTSPHLQSWRERIRVDGVAIAPSALAREVKAVIEGARRLRRRSHELGEPSAFELLTVAALAHFARRRCRVAVLEVGLGGRFDATNAVDPAVSVITSIGLDHRAILGGTLARIAREKAGILRAGRAGLIAPQRPAAARAIAAACRETGALCSTVPPVPRRTRLGLAGEHQRENAALARSAARALREAGLDIGKPAVARGLRHARWPGRLEKVGSRPVVILDAAHSPESSAALAAALGRFRGRVQLVFGCTSDRDPRAIIAPLLPVVAGIHATAASGHRAMPAERVARALGAVATPVPGPVAEAIARARRAAGPAGVVCVTGSVALVGEARTALGLRPVERLWEVGASKRR